MKDFTCVNESHQDSESRLPGKKAKCSKQPTKITSFLSLKTHKNGGEKRENLLYVNNSKGLID